MDWIFEFLGLALIYATAGTAAISLLIFPFRGISINLIFLLFAILIFLILTQHPLPDRTTMICPIKSAEPQLIPFGFVQIFVRLSRYDAPILDWLLNVTIAAAIMNVVLCAAIGAALAFHVAKWWSVFAFGIGLTLLVELTQLTGAWGLYPCAWRKFDVDDLITNILGVAMGWGWMRHKQARA